VKKDNKMNCRGKKDTRGRNEEESIIRRRRKINVTGNGDYTAENHSKGDYKKMSKKGTCVAFEARTKRRGELESRKRREQHVSSNAHGKEAEGKITSGKRALDPRGEVRGELKRRGKNRERFQLYLRKVRKKAHDGSE